MAYRQTYLQRVKQTGCIDRVGPIGAEVLGTGQSITAQTGGVILGTQASTISEAGGLGGTMLGAYHGYKRNSGSVGMAIVWALLGGIFWPIAVPIMLVQGLGKKK